MVISTNWRCPQIPQNPCDNPPSRTEQEALIPDAFHETKYVFFIYAVYDLKASVVFVGKTRSKNPRVRFAAHLRGEVKTT